MTYKLKLLAAGSGLALAALGASPVFASGTTAGTVISNTAKVDYTVGGVAQTQLSASNTLTVDRKIIVTTAVVDAAPVSVTPGQAGTATSPVLVFSVTNSSNAVIDIGLAAVAQASGVAVGFSKTSNFVAGNTYVFHTGSVAGPIVTYLDEVPIDQVTNIYVVNTTPTAIPLTATNGQFAGVTLTATAEQSGAAGTQGAVVTQNSSGNWGGATVLNNVLAEPAGFGTDVKNDGVSVASDVYVVSAPVLSVNKLSYVVWDPVNLTTSPKAIPGAIVRYCIVVTNAAGGASATPTVGDTLPGQVTAVANSLFLNGTNSTGPLTCNTSFAGFTTGTGASGAAAATQITTATTSISNALNALAGGSSETLYFDVTIN